MEHKDNKLNNLVDKLMKNDTLESPSLDFTNSVMQRIEAEELSRTTVYKPLISKTVWGILSLVIVAFVAYMYVYEPGSSSEWFDKLNFSILNQNPLEGINLEFSKTTMYALLLFAIMIGIQIPVLKNYLNKRIAL